MASFFTRPKHLLLAAAIILIITVPAIFVSGVGMSWMEGWVDAHQSSPRARSLLLQAAFLYRLTLRPEQESDALEKYLRYFTEEAQPKNYDADEYLQTASRWCVAGEALSISQQKMLERWHRFLFGEMNYWETRPEVQEVIEGYAHFKRLGGENLYREQFR